MITKDFTSAYSEKGCSRYELFQLKIFNQIRDYLYENGNKHALVLSLFQDMEQEVITCVFPAMYNAICNAIHEEIIRYLAKGNLENEESAEAQLQAEDDAQLYRMHGWALYELKTKSVYKEHVEVFIMPKEEKKNLPHSLKYLDVGTKTGLTFPKTTFMDFMRKSDTFIHEQITDDKFQTYGQNIISVAKTLTHSNLELQQLFQQAAALCCELDTDTVLCIYKIWVEKYLNMKMKGRFTDACERLDTDKSKKLTTKTLNLRDNLLPNHVA